VTRGGSKNASQLAANVRMVIVDYSSLKSLVHAFEGCDVVVNALGNRLSHEHVSVLDAAIAARIPRFIPSFWSLINRTDAVQSIPFTKRKLDIADVMEQAASEGKITFTAFTGGPWIDWIMRFSTLMSVPERTFYMHEAPDFEICMSSRDSFAIALVAALRKPAETKNKYLDIEVIRISQNRALQLAREALPGEEIKVIQASFKERFEKGMQQMYAGKTDKFTWADILCGVIFNPEAYPPPEISGNDLLGVERLTEKEFKDLLKEMSSNSQR
jgi:hypothetical protein